MTRKQIFAVSIVAVFVFVVGVLWLVPGAWHAVVWGNLGVVVVGGLGVGAALLTLGQMKSQVNQMVAQSVAIGKQLELAEKQADAATDNARAARDNLRAFIDRDRARLEVKEPRKPVGRPQVHDAATTVGAEQNFEINWVELEIGCAGATPAFEVVLAARAWASDRDVPEIPQARFRIALGTIAPANPPTTRDVYLDESVDAAAVDKQSLFLHVAGELTYKDVFGFERSERFCYTWESFSGLFGPDSGLWMVSGPR